MEQSQSHLKLTLISSFLLGILFFGLGFDLAYYQDKTHLIELAQLADSHLTYAFQLKDDMALIDESKKLESFNGILAFRATENSKIIAEGGNRNYLLNILPEGSSYSFPAQWSFHFTHLKDSKNSGDFTIVYRSNPGPLLWGVYFFLVSFISGFLKLLVSSLFRFSSTPSTKIIPQTKPENKAMAARVPILKDISNPSLFLDKNYVIKDVSPQAATLLGADSDSLVNRHLLDLSPDPALMQAIEKSLEVKISKPFLSYPHLAVRLRFDSQGTLLILEPAVPTMDTQKH